MSRDKFYICDLEGEWIQEYKSYNCSICERIALSINVGGEYTQFLSDYCPHCGALMIRRKNNERE